MKIRGRGIHLYRLQIGLNRLGSLEANLEALGHVNQVGRGVSIEPLGNLMGLPVLP